MFVVTILLGFWSCVPRSSMIYAGKEVRLVLGAYISDTATKEQLMWRYFSDTCGPQYDTALASINQMRAAVTVGDQMTQLGFCISAGPDCLDHGITQSGSRWQCRTSAVEWFALADRELLLCLG